MGQFLSTPVVDKELGGGHSATKGLSYGFASMQGWRTAMEDAHTCLPDFTGDGGLFAVYDGHGGDEVAKYCQKYLPDYLLQQLSTDSSGDISSLADADVQGRLEKCFLRLDETLSHEDTAEELRDLSSTRSEDEQGEGDEEEGPNLESAGMKPLQALLNRMTQKSNGTEEGGLDLSSLMKQSLVKAIIKHANDVSSDESSEEGGEEQEDEERGEEKDKDVDDQEDSGNGELDGGVEEEDEAKDEEGGGEDTHEEVPNGEITENGVEKQPAEDGEEVVGQSAEDGEEVVDQSDEEEDSSEDEDEGLMMNQESGPGVDSGTTAVVALYLVSKDKNRLFVANVGDSRCVLCRNGTALDLSEDHKPEDEGESARILAAGGRIKDGRINMGLNLSRALGDHVYKRNEALPPESQMVSAMPDVKCTEIDPDTDQFMIVACDGIWNMKSSEEAVEFVKSRFSSESLTSISQQLVDSCLAPDTDNDGSGCDNMTALVVSFRPHSLTQDIHVPCQPQPAQSPGQGGKRTLESSSPQTTPETDSKRQKPDEEGN